MVTCIYCKKEIDSDKIKQHISEEHLGLSSTKGLDGPLPIAPTLAITPKTTTVNTTEKPSPITPSENEPIKHTPTLPLEKPKKRYLNADEIITLLHNVNQTFPKIEIPPCPINKQEE